VQRSSWRLTGADTQRIDDFLVIVGYTSLLFTFTFTLTAVVGDSHYGQLVNDHAPRQTSD